MKPPPFHDRLAAALTAASVRARVVRTTNRVRLISARRGADGVEVRVSARVEPLGDPLIAEIVRWLGGARGAAGRLRELVRVLPAAPSAPRAVRVAPSGDHHDLAALAEAEVRRYFPDAAPPPITWGQRPSRSRRRQRTIRLGSYDPVHRLIRIHPYLDHPRVPAWFVGFVIYHELLHHELGVPSKRDGGRPRRLHDATFRAREAAHHRYGDARRWEQMNIASLLDGSL